jgi:hypothetical protein
VRLPLLQNHTAADVVIAESGVVVWVAGAFKPGSADGVDGASAEEEPSGAGVVVDVKSGSYKFTMM